MSYSVGLAKVFALRHWNKYQQGIKMKNKIMVSCPARIFTSSLSQSLVFFFFCVYLQNGPKQVYGGPALSQAPPKHSHPEYSTSTEAAHPTISAQRKEDPEFHQSPSPGNITSSLGQDGVIKSTNRNENPTPANDLQRDTRPQSSEILEKARTAIAAAERATATARAAAQLANVKFSTPKLEEQKS